MIYRVQVAATAKKDAEAAYLWLKSRTPAHCAEWFNGLVDVINDLAVFPKRWPLARESVHFDEEIRQMLYGRKPHFYRVLFVVRGGAVHVLHIRHGARRAMGASDVIWPN